MNSTRLTEASISRAIEALETTSETLSTWHGAPLHFTRHRGDGWQVVLKKPELALRSALAFRAALRSLGRDFDSYFGIATGTAAGPFGPDLNSATSPVFAESGHSLDFAKATSVTRMSYNGGGVFAAVTVLIDHISQSWTPAQAAAVKLLIEPSGSMTHAEAAKVLGKSRQAVSKAVEAASHAQLDYALRLIEATTDA